MVADFALGANCPINYEEYVLIDTPNKNHPDNGKIFRRGFDFNSVESIEYSTAYETTIEDQGQAYKDIAYDIQSIAGHGAILIGSFVGPAGHAPKISIDDFDDIPQTAPNRTFDFKNETGFFDMIPGKVPNQNVWNDHVEYKYATFRYLDNEDTELVFGLKVPYTTFNVTAEALEPNEEIQIVREDDGTHPFYYKWNFRIPRGHQGDSISNLRSFPVTVNSIFPTIDGNIEAQHQVYAGQQILIYDVTRAVNNPIQGQPSIETITYYLEDDKSIEEIKLNEYQHMLIRYKSTYEGDYPANQRITEVIGNEPNQKTIYWLDLGLHKDYGGIYGTELIYTESDIINYLNTTLPYSNGLDGKIVIVKNSVEDNSPELYAYDDIQHTWFYLGDMSMSEATPRSAVLYGIEDDIINNKLNRVNDYYFLIETFPEEGDSNG